MGLTTISGPGAALPEHGEQWGRPRRSLTGPGRLPAPNASVLALAMSTGLPGRRYQGLGKLLRLAGWRASAGSAAGRVNWKEPALSPGREMQGRAEQLWWT